MSQIKENLTKKKLLKNSKIETLLGFLKHYIVQDTIYPGVLIRKLHISMKEAYQVLDEIEEMGYIRLNFEVYCHVDNKFTGDAYETLSQMPPYVYCEECNRELIPFKESVSTYKVIIDE